MKKHLHLFAQLAKIDETKHEVWGVATAEMVDKEGEIFDYASSKPYFKTWSDEIAKATDGKSLGNVREMHEPSAVGKLVALNFDDELKQIYVGAKIVDPTAWQKCMEGVYTGFSIGGQYVKAWKDGEYIRFTANPAEISVVDNPCVPGAHFTAVKADGQVEIRKFVRPVRKDLGTVSALAYILQCASSLQMDSSAEAATEGDDSTLPDQLKAWVNEGVAILASMTQEELGELAAGVKSMRGRMGKVGAKHSAETKAHHDAINKGLGKIAKAATDAQDHCAALADKDDGGAAMAAWAHVHKYSADTTEHHDAINKCLGKIAKAAADAQDHCAALADKDDGGAAMAAWARVHKHSAASFSEAQPEIHTGELQMLEPREKEQLERARADSASSLSKIEEVEETVSEMRKGQEQIAASIANLTKIIGKMAGIEEGGMAVHKVHRAASPHFITKEQDSGGAGVNDLSKLKPEERLHEEMKKALMNPVLCKEQPGFYRTAR